MIALGIDVGSMFLKIVGMNERREVIFTEYKAHLGEAEETLWQLLSERQLITEDVSVAFTGSLSEAIASSMGFLYIDEVRAAVTFARTFFPDVRNIMDIGGGSLTLIRLDDNGTLMEFSTNSLCAAGTGAFLDEQVDRLHISYDCLDNMKPIENPPVIATRCAVFAKSDLIHHQQAGRSREEMWSGLCRGMTETILHTLLKGRPITGKTLTIGGVVLNREVLKWLNKTSYEFKIPSHGHIASAIGAALRASDEGVVAASKFYFLISSLLHKTVEDSYTRRPRLELRQSKYPSFEPLEEYVDDDGNEVCISQLLSSGHLPVGIGVDIGSTSTKLAVVDARDRKVVIDIYRRTLGEPVEASKKIFRALKNYCDEKGIVLDVRALGTTGSGRKLVGKVIGADSIINEISAHATGALSVDPDIETIFEIGGQDSKYMHLKNGLIHDSNMNYVCAAGTGSFVEEQAKRLGYKVTEIGDAVMGISPPYTSDRCTVFMEHDVRKLLKAGFTQAEALAAILYSVIQNYRNRVVGNRYVSDTKIMFQGATARNRGLIAAIENILGVEVVVSPYCHILGAYGVALISLDEIAGEKSRFRAFDILTKKVEITTEQCTICSNSCRLTIASLEGGGEKPSWGYQCGRDPEELKPRSIAGFAPFENQRRLFNRSASAQLPSNAPLIAIPRSLSMYSLFPFWKEFFAHLGYEVKLTSYTNSEIKTLANKIIAADFCCPMKVASGGFLKALLDDSAEFIFFPYMIADEERLPTAFSYYCPYLQAAPSLLRSVAESGDLPLQKLLSPLIDFRRPDKDLVVELHTELGKRLNVSKGSIARALTASKTFIAGYRDVLTCEGEDILSELERSGKQGIVIIGRPYNVYDKGMNLNLPQKIAEYGYAVVPLDMLRLDIASLATAEYFNLYWSYGQSIIAALKRIKYSANLFPVYFTNFNCGPDSFLLGYAEKEMADKPMLVLELDEHEADGGYLTRIEAFLDILRAQAKKPKTQQRRLSGNMPGRVDFKRRTIWIPPIHPITTRLFAAAFRGFGYKAEALPPESTSDFELGRKLTRGSECLPTALTIGVFVNTLKKMGAKPHDTAFFMPTAEGPCRFGQYCLLHKNILDSSEFKGVEILSPSSINSYQGLDEDLRRYLWRAVMSGDILYKVLLKTRPYEVNRGDAGEALERNVGNLCDAFERREDHDESLRRALGELASIPTTEAKKPLVGIVGEIYVRLNHYANENVIEAVEKGGGEAQLVPMHEWFIYTSYMQSWLARRRRFNLIERGENLLKNIYLFESEKTYYRLAGRILSDRLEPEMKEILMKAKKYLPLDFIGEALLTVGRTIIFAQNGATMVINCAPFGCMPGTITAGIFSELQARLGIPIVNQFYDGGGDLNKKIESYLTYISPDHGRYNLAQRKHDIETGTEKRETRFS
ncbi:MAG TPA: acyl-CoA dehydratase activase [Syntrophales bacterium]|nr:acyl-CoA dehydratase activase [Syntrophales bacterium]